MTRYRLLVSSAAALLAASAASFVGCGGGGQSTGDAAGVVPGDSAAPAPDAGIPAHPDAAAPGPDAAAPGHLWQTTLASPLVAPGDPNVPLSFPSATTFRVPFTNMRTGTKVQVAFRGDESGGMELTGVWIGRDLGSGTVAENTQLLFGGQPGTSVPASVTAVSDPLDFTMKSGERYAVSFVATGTVPHALTDINFEGFRVGGSQADRATLSGPTIDPALRGVKWVAVFGEPTRVVAVLGDSIGAGEASGGTDRRFMDLAQKQLGHPVVDSSVGGDGVATTRIDRDVLSLPGITDCLVELGTNDLHQANDPNDPRPGKGLEAGKQFIIDGLTNIYTRLDGAGFRVWGATILPKGLKEDGVTPILTANGEAARVAVNDWIKGTPLVVGVVDFAAAIADPTDSSKPAEGMLAQDGIHPLNQGHQAMADKMVEAFGGSLPDAGAAADAGAGGAPDAGQ